ncbi:MAG: class I SAM-dependent methyltransferase [Rubripirellula sp.]
MDTAVSHEVSCPCCTEQNCEQLYDLPLGEFFAGKWVDPGLPGGSMMGCRTCHLHFRWPRLSKHEMDVLYEAGSETNWTAEAGMRQDWRRVQKQIEQLTLSDPSILDIACFDGRFLELLPNQFKKSGVEIQPEAAQRASDRGVEIIANNFEELEDCQREFSVVTAFDILEHTHHPLQFIERASKLLAPGGYLIIGTGNTDAVSWKIMGRYYWYSATVEHIAFVNRRWCQYVGNQLGLDVARFETLSHKRMGSAKIARDWALNVLFRCSPALTRGSIRTLRRVVGSQKETSPTYLPPWHSAKDHLLVTFQKPE